MRFIYLLGIVYFAVRIMLSYLVFSKVESDFSFVLSLPMHSLCFYQIGDNIKCQKR
jgi:hypothetical protein